MADAGLIFGEKGDLAIVAGLALKMATDRILKDSILAKQGQRRLSFLPQFILPQLFALVDKLGA